MNLLHKAAVLTWALTALYSGSRADLVSLDYKTEGDHLLTLDSKTQLEWLDITATVGHVRADLDALTSGAGPFTGFRLATDLEFKALLADQGIPLLSFSSDPALLTKAAQLQALIGSVPKPIVPPPGVPFIGLGNYTFGSLDITEGGSPLGYGRLTLYNLVGGQTWYGAEAYASTFAYPDPVIGLYLVRSSAVPEPATYGLAASLFLAALMAVRRRSAR